jgi:putative Ca2+/H+ antiporter (TMEM165/GDT1 family)
MEAFITSALLVAIAEIGDKTQLLSFVLAARLREPLPIIAGIFVATVANHALAGSLGVWLAQLIPSVWMPWIAGVTFVAFGLWTLVPDHLDDEDAQPRNRFGVFVTTVVAFFFAEMGDKTQFATIALGARFNALVPVVFGTTLGMMAANVPAVLIGESLAKKLPLQVIRWIAAGLFVATGIAAMFFSGS